MVTNNDRAFYKFCPEQINNHYLPPSFYSTKTNFFMRSKFQLIVLLVISALFFSSCSDKGAASVDMNKLKPDIQAMEDAYAAAEKAKDAAGVVAYYSDDAISYN